MDGGYQQSLIENLISEIKFTKGHTLLENGKKKKNISFFGATLRNPIGKSSQFTTIDDNGVIM